MVSEYVFHDHPADAPCSVECWTLDDAPWDRGIREKRLEHNHIFQVQPEDLPNRECPACATINLSHMKGKPYKTGRNSYDMAFNGGGWS